MRTPLHRPVLLAILLTSLVARPRLDAETVTFPFANLGTSYSAALFQDDRLVGHEVTGARIFLEIISNEGSDAATFQTDLLLPIELSDPNESSALVLTGEALGWSGAGHFEYTEETNRFNGIFIPRRYGAETFGEQFLGEMLQGRIELDVPGLVRGDFDGDLELDADDLDLLTDDIRFEFQTASFDLNQDSTVDEIDRQIWVEEVRRTYFGDSNLDGQFDSTDLVDVFAAGEYEDAEEGNSSWATGDWNGDGEFTTTDLVFVFSAGGYDAGPRAAEAVAVPEPSTVGALGLCVCWLIRHTRQAASHRRRSA